VGVAPCLGAGLQRPYDWLSIRGGRHEVRGHDDVVVATERIGCMVSP
jgi:hypothetical protein